MSDHNHDIRVPRQALIGAAALVGFALVGTAWTSLTRDNAPDVRLALIEPVEIVIEDDADGGVSIYDFGSGERLARYEPETGGFVRVALRALAFDRRKAGVGPEAPLRLGRTAGGGLVIEDETTNRRIALHAFGGGNAESFERILVAQEIDG